MVNIDKHISHWRNGAEEDFEVADQLIRSGKIRHGLFFLHLTLEKILKAHVCLNSGDIAPNLHNLSRLAELSGITFRQEHSDFLAEMNPLNRRALSRNVGTGSVRGRGGHTDTENRRIIRMAEESVIISVRKYLNELLRIGVPVRFGIMFGSHARKNTHRWSDIDLLVISSLYDESCSREDINLLWRTAARTDNRIEPVPVGLNCWETDDGSTIIEIARREGIRVTV